MILVLMVGLLVIALIVFSKKPDQEIYWIERWRKGMAGLAKFNHSVEGKERDG